tara:strand:+ start:41662 stop:42972 length:1311 start_codon:yes stop_codon:yes gene_type:complete
MTKQRLQQKQKQKLSAKQIQFLGLLQIPIVSLEKRIEEEIEENPALEEEEEEEQQHYSSYKTNNYEHFQIEDKLESLTDHLSKQLVGSELSDNSLFLVKYIINSLDDNGFLSRDLYSLSSDLLTGNNLSVEESELNSALKTVQSLEPYGVGAANLQECLLIQLKRLFPINKVAYEVISMHYTAFSNKNYEYLVRELKIKKDELKEIYSLIESLNPIPSAGFSKNNHSNEYIYPDFKVVIHNNNLELLLTKSSSRGVTISKYYSELLEKTEDTKTKVFLKERVEKAEWFKESIKKRQETLKKVMSAIIQLQKKYFISGHENDLRPMRLADVASIVKMDISTISRVSNSKYIETHFGTFKVKELFSEAYRKNNGEFISTNEIKNSLLEIISSENKKAPFNDDQLANLLGKEEYDIARRTVAKYREQLGIETAKLRRKL